MRRISVLLVLLLLSSVVISFDIKILNKQVLSPHNTDKFGSGKLISCEDDGDCSHIVCPSATYGYKVVSYKPCCTKDLGEKNGICYCALSCEPPEDCKTNAECNDGTLVEYDGCDYEVKLVKRALTNKKPLTYIDVPWLTYERKIKDRRECEFGCCDGKCIDNGYEISNTYPPEECELYKDEYEYGRFEQRYLFAPGKPDAISAGDSFFVCSSYYKYCVIVNTTSKRIEKTKYYFLTPYGEILNGYGDGKFIYLNNKIYAVINYYATGRGYITGIFTTDTGVSFNGMECDSCNNVCCPAILGCNNEGRGSGFCPSTCVGPTNPHICCKSGCGKSEGNNILVQVAELPNPIAEFSIAKIDDKMYIIGGYSTNIYKHCQEIGRENSLYHYYLYQYPLVNTIWEYDPGTNSLTKKFDEFPGRYGMKSISVNGKIYIFPGMRSKSPFKYDINKNNYNVMCKGYELSDDEISVEELNGYNAVDHDDTILEYDPGTNTITEKLNLGNLFLGDTTRKISYLYEKRRHSYSFYEIAPYGKYIYIFGLSDEDCYTTNPVYRYNTETNTIEREKYMKYAPWAVATKDDLIYLFGMRKRVSDTNSLTTNEVGDDADAVYIFHPCSDRTTQSLDESQENGEECKDENSCTTDYRDSNGNCVHDLSCDGSTCLIGSDDYCQYCIHCGDGICNCGETPETCPDDCSSDTLSVELVFPDKVPEDSEINMEIAISNIHENFDLVVTFPSDWQLNSWNSEFIDKEKIEFEEKEINTATSLKAYRWSIPSDSESVIISYDIRSPQEERTDDIIVVWTSQSVIGYDKKTIDIIKYCERAENCSSVECSEGTQCCDTSTHTCFCGNEDCSAQTSESETSEEEICKGGCCSQTDEGIKFSLEVGAISSMRICNADFTKEECLSEDTCGVDRACLCKDYGLNSGRECELECNDREISYFVVTDSLLNGERVSDVYTCNCPPLSINEEMRENIIEMKDRFQKAKEILTQVKSKVELSDMSDEKKESYMETIDEIINIIDETIDYINDNIDKPEKYTDIMETIATAKEEILRKIGELIGD